MAVSSVVNDSGYSSTVAVARGADLPSLMHNARSELAWALAIGFRSRKLPLAVRLSRLETEWHFYYMPTQNAEQEQCSRAVSNPPWSTTWQNITTQPVRRQGRNQPTPYTCNLHIGRIACVRARPSISPGCLVRESWEHGAGQLHASCCSEMARARRVEL